MTPFKAVCCLERSPYHAIMVAVVVHKMYNTHASRLKSIENLNFRLGFQIKDELKMNHCVVFVHRGWSPKFATRLNIRFTTTSGHFFANYMSIFHKTEVQTVILRCWTSLYLNWFKSYERNAKKRKNAKNAKTQEIIIQITTFLQNQ